MTQSDFHTAINDAPRHTPAEAALGAISKCLDELDEGGRTWRALQSPDILQSIERLKFSGLALRRRVLANTSARGDLDPDPDLVKEVSEWMQSARSLCSRLIRSPIWGKLVVLSLLAVAVFGYGVWLSYFCESCAVFKMPHPGPGVDYLKEVDSSIKDGATPIAKTYIPYIAMFSALGVLSYGSIFVYSGSTSSYFSKIIVSVLALPIPILLFSYYKAAKIFSTMLRGIVPEMQGAAQKTADIANNILSLWPGSKGGGSGSVPAVVSSSVNDLAKGVNDVMQQTASVLDAWLLADDAVLFLFSFFSGFGVPVLIWLIHSQIVPMVRALRGRPGSF